MTQKYSTNEIIYIFEKEEKAICAITFGDILVLPL